MAWGRLISKSLGSSRKYHALLAAAGPLGEFCQVLFPLLVANTDDFGRYSGDAFTVKHAVLPTSPRPEAEFDQALTALAHVQLIQVYQVHGHRYLQIADFQSHQQFKHRRLARYPDATGHLETGGATSKATSEGGPISKEVSNLSNLSKKRARSSGPYLQDPKTQAEYLAKLKAWNDAHPEKANADDPRRRDH